jgi:uncharacterized membrane protein YqjE
MLETQTRSPIGLLVTMIHTRLELAASDLESHFSATLAALALAFAAVVLSLVAFTFIGIVIIVAFWDTHRLIASLAVTAAYAGLALTCVMSARARWRRRPEPLAQTLHELALDREAVRRAT